MITLTKHKAMNTENNLNNVLMINNTGVERYYIAHNNNDVVHYSRVCAGCEFSTGQPFIEEFDNEAEWIARINELKGIEYWYEDKHTDIS